MKIFYLTNARLPTEKAHGLATVKLCAAFAKQGAEVIVFAPWRQNPLKADLYEYYGVERNFRVHCLPSIDLLWLPFGKRAFFLIQLFSFSFIAALWLSVRYRLWGGLGDTVIFSHDHIPLFFASFFAPNIFYDIHHYPEPTLLYTRVLRRAAGLAVQTKWKVTALGRDFGVPASKIVYWPNGTDVGRFDIPVSRQEARERLGLGQDKNIALYAGSLQRWKGVETLVAAARQLPVNALVYVVGGEPRDIERLKTLNPKPPPAPSPPAGRVGLRRAGETLNPVFVGQRPWTEIPLWLKAADALLLPNTGREKVSRFYTSPMKLFEYMASGRPIVASDIPSIREIADETMVFFAAPDDPRSFAGAIGQALADPADAAGRAERSRQEVRRYTWEARAARILAHIKRLW